jgi:N,N'-diacetyllegionaminate synthase
MLDEAVGARVDRIKTQSHQTRHLSKDDPQYAWMARAEMTDLDHAWIIKECHKKGMGYLTTPFHADRVPFLADLGLDAIKIGSGEASNPVMLEAIARYPWKVYLSTGLVTGWDLDQAVRILDRPNLTLLHTVSEYPTPTRHVNLGRMSWLATRHGLPVGYSDHTAGIHAPLAAIARGAAVVEVHFAASGAVPRRNAWDKDREDLTTLVLFRDAMETMMAPGRMLWGHTEERPYVGRWQH